MALTIVLRPGITATDLSARNTRNVRKAENEPKSEKKRENNGE